MGEKPSAFDVLAWNADGTNLPGAVRAQFLDLFPAQPAGGAGGDGRPGNAVRLGDIDPPTFVTGARADHLRPWTGCYRTTQLLGGEATIVLSYSGHIASLVNPPGNPTAHYGTGGRPGRTRRPGGATPSR